MTTESNWAGNHAYAFGRCAAPGSVPELSELVAASAKVRALGSRHSFNANADCEDLLVDLTGLAEPPVVDAERQTVRVTPGTRFADVIPVVAAAGFALPNLGSLPHISVCGALATGTHGSGTGNQILGAAASLLEIVDGDGGLRTLRRGEPDFEGAVVGLGAAGLVVAVELDLVPSFDVVQSRELARWSDVVADAADTLTSAYSVSLFTRWTDDEPTEILRKTRVEPDGGAGVPTAPPSSPSGLLGDGPHLTVVDQQVAWWMALPHFSIDHEPSFGDEIQSEFFVPSEHTREALEAVTAHAAELAPLLHVTEIRAVAADDLWMSPVQGRDSTVLHFTWLNRPDEVAEATRTVQRALAPYAARPHWGKVFDADLVDVAALYPRTDDFVDLITRLDPRGRFVNPWLAELLPGLRR